MSNTTDNTIFAQLQGLANTFATIAGMADPKGAADSEAKPPKAPKVQKTAGEKSLDKAEQLAADLNCPELQRLQEEKKRRDARAALARKRDLASETAKTSIFCEAAKQIELMNAPEEVKAVLRAERSVLLAPKDSGKDSGKGKRTSKDNGKGKAPDAAHNVQ